MNNILVRLPDHTSNRILSLLSVTLTISMGLVLVFSTLQVENYLKFAEAQLENNTIGGTFGYNNNRTSTILENSTLDAGRNVTVQDLTLPELFERVEKSVVQVTTTSGSDQLDLFRSGIGSGFVYNNDGLIVTNYHVIAPSVLSSESVRGETNNGVDINVAFEDGTIYPATLVGADRFSDIAIIDVPDDARDRLVPLPIGNSSELRVGQQVVAIGNPFGLSGSMTEGIVSGLGRMIPSSQESPRNPSGDILPPAAQPSSSTYSIPDIIQIDAPINPGNSGGPLLNIRGEVIGINTAIFSTTGASAGIGFAIPSNTIKKVVPSLIATGSYQHPYIGIAGTDITPEIADVLGLAEARGFLVTDVTPASPAQKAGIQGGNGGDSLTTIGGREMKIGGDVILKIDDRTVRKIDDMLTYLERDK